MRNKNPLFVLDFNLISFEILFIDIIPSFDRIIICMLLMDLYRMIEHNFSENSSFFFKNRDDDRDSGTEESGESMLFSLKKNN